MKPSLKEVAETKERYLDTLRMLSDRGCPFAIVEGKSDTITLRKFLIVPLLVAYGGNNNKECVKRSCEWLREAVKTRACFGIMDTDFDFIEALLEYGPEKGAAHFKKIADDYASKSVFYTDSHDLEVDVFWSTAENVIRDLFDNDKDKPTFSMYLRRLTSDESRQKGYSDSVKEATDKVMQAALEIGTLRLLLFRKRIPQHIEISLCCSRKLVVRHESVLDSHASKSCDKNCMREAYSELRESLATMMDMDIVRHMVNGHDLVDLLCFIIVQSFGPGTKDSLVETLGTILSKSFDSSDFKKLNLYEDIKAWSDSQNLKVLRY